MVHSGNYYLSSSEMLDNAKYIYNYFIAKGWSANAICGMLGNMQVESTINPGIWQDLKINFDAGFGLVQWTPASNYRTWALINNLEPESMNANLLRIEYELDNGIQWIMVERYLMTFREFTTSNYTPEYLAEIFLYSYERAGDEKLEQRKANARYWYDVLYSGETPNPPVDPDEPGGDTPTPTPTPTKKKKGYNFVLFGASKRLRSML